ncbi:hypothetical protein MUK42_30716 [Musa troglodytarum]|uniref:Uncharacterized protein n=1 Tax=Musa troglodytarum TaxID=320322 RepID=A0A9E7FWK0_9LILI|nr:hypothetical protein MUK42_30716 [Musa troglodytarum]
MYTDGYLDLLKRLEKVIVNINRRLAEFDESSVDHGSSTQLKAGRSNGKEENGGCSSDLHQELQSDDQILWPLYLGWEPPESYRLDTLRR